MTKTIMATLLASSMLLSGCGAVGLATGVGAAVGVSAAKEGGIKSAVTDESIRLKISDLWFKRDINIFGKLSLSVNQGRVLVTGVVQKPEDRMEAIRLAWQPEGVKQVINEIRIGEGGTVGTYAQDVWISGQLRTKLTFDKYVQSINYSIETVQGSVYLMGVAQHQAELDRAISLARQIKGVKEVISYVKLAGEPIIPSASSSMSQENSSMNYSNSQTDPVPLSTGMDAPSYDSGYNNNTVSSSPSSSSIQSEVLPP